MRCLKRYAAREIYHQITNPQAAPNNTDLRQKRTELGCPPALQNSPLERGILRNDTLAANTRQWLTDQTGQRDSP